jgi:DNA-binding MarR family transcriptional regulator
MDIPARMTRPKTASPKRKAAPKTRSPRPGRAGVKKAVKAAPVSSAPAQLGRLSRQIGYLLRRASSVFTTHWNLQFQGEAVTITPVQCGMLILIDENPGLTQIELARLLKVEGSTLWQLISRLLELGFIHRYRVPEDQRAFAIHLSRGGRQALLAFERGLQQHQRALLDCLSESERADLSAVLLRVIEAGDRLNEGVEMSAKASPMRQKARG